MKERRLADRIEVSVQMEGRRNGDVFLGTSVNVSESGLLIQTNKILNLGDMVKIRLVSSEQDEIVGVGRVVRSEEHGLGYLGYAVRWELTPDQKMALAELIRINRR